MLTCQFLYRVDFLFAGIILSILIGVGFAALTLSGKMQEAVKLVRYLPKLACLFLLHVADLSFLYSPRPGHLSRSTKASLNDKGVNISASGISVKTDRNMDREAYLDATQRYVIVIRSSISSYSFIHSSYGLFIP
jgi:hypothetical protein